LRPCARCQEIPSQSTTEVLTSYYLNLVNSVLSFPQFSFRAPALRSPCPLTPHARPAPIASTGHLYADKSSAFSIGYGQPDNPFFSSLIEEDGGMERALRFSAVPTHCCVQVFPSTCPESKACALFAPKHRGGNHWSHTHGPRITSHRSRITNCRPLLPSSAGPPNDRMEV